jgi:Rieske Fe-S protein
MLSAKPRSRRCVLRWIGGGIGSVFLLSFRSVAERLSAIASEARRVVIPADSARDVVFADDAVVCRGAGGVGAFRARCSHLGCRIAHEADGLLVCPCHGSRFRLDGTVAAGPAAQPLEPLRHSTDKDGGITVEL